jgi:peptidoglycan/xylan/chitin deacetylase (PgdA/CDA1 family)
VFRVELDRFGIATAPESCLFDWTKQQCGSCDDLGAITGCNQPGTIHLTIDDGPSPRWTTVLDVLAWKNVKATFLVVGQLVTGPNAPANAAAIMQRIVNEGHTIGCYSGMSV